MQKLVNSGDYSLKTCIKKKIIYKIYVDTGVNRFVCYLDISFEVLMVFALRWVFIRRGNLMLCHLFVLYDRTAKITLIEILVNVFIKNIYKKI